MDCFLQYENNQNKGDKFQMTKKKHRLPISIRG